MKIALFGVFGVNNFGNEASLVAMLRQVERRQLDAELLCICTTPSKVSSDHMIAAIEMIERIPRKEALLSNWVMRLLCRAAGRFGLFRVLRVFRAFGHMRDVDLFIVPGTGILDDFGVNPWGMPYYLLMWCSVARLCGAKVFFNNIGAGPIEHPLSRWFMKQAARTAHYRSFRDDISRDFIRSLGVDVSRDAVLPDLVFSLPTADFDQEPGSSINRVTVAVGVMAYYGWENHEEKGHSIYDAYIRRISGFVAWLLDSGYSVRIVIGETTDQLAVDDVLSHLSSLTENGLNWLVVNSLTSLADVLREMSFADVVVATRFHNIICALMLGKPVISLGYAQKNEVLLSGVQLSRYCQHIERLDVNLLKNHFNEVLQQRKHYRDLIRERNKEYRNLIDVQFDEMFASFQLGNVEP